MKINRKNDLEYITFDNLEQTGIGEALLYDAARRCQHRLLGKHEHGLCARRGTELVLQNYKILAEAVGFTAENYVTSQQTHTTNVRRVTAADAGKGVWTERGYTDVDGLITNEKHIPFGDFRGRLCTCVPFG